MKVSTTNSTETVTCSNCGKDALQRNCCGVRYRGRMTWTCVDCITDGAMDAVFAPIGKDIRTEIQKGTPR